MTIIGLNKEIEPGMGQNHFRIVVQSRTFSGTYGWKKSGGVRGVFPPRTGIFKNVVNRGVKG